MPPLSRRRFLQLTAIPCGVFASATGIPGAQRGLEQFLLPAPPCKDDLTPAVPAGREFRAGAPVRGSLIADGVIGTSMKLSGYVSGLTCGRVKGARVDFWQADAAGAYDMNGSRLRGAVQTDAEGKYSIETIVPGPRAGRASCIGVRIQATGKPVLVTQLFFPDDPAALKDVSFKPALVMKRVGAPTSRTYTFDFLLDI